MNLASTKKLTFDNVGPDKKSQLDSLYLFGPGWIAARYKNSGHLNVSQFNNPTDVITVENEHPVKQIRSTYPFVVTLHQHAAKDDKYQLQYLDVERRTFYRLNMWDYDISRIQVILYTMLGVFIVMDKGFQLIDLSDVTHPRVSLLPHGKHEIIPQIRSSSSYSKMQGEYFVVSSSHTFQLWQYDEEEELVSLVLQGSVAGSESILLIDFCNATVVVNTVNKLIFFFRTASMEVLQTTVPSPVPVSALNALAGNCIVTGDLSGTIAVYSVNRREKLHNLNLEAEKDTIDVLQSSIGPTATPDPEATSPSESFDFLEAVNSDKKVLFIACTDLLIVVAKEHSCSIWSLRQPDKPPLRTFSLKSSIRSLHLWNNTIYMVVKSKEGMEVVWWDPPITRMKKRITEEVERQTSSDSLRRGEREDREQLVVIGGGLLGAFVAKSCEKKFDVVLVDSRDYLEFSHVLIPGITDHPSFRPFINQVTIKHKKYLKKARFIKGTVEAISPSHVALADQSIMFDYLVIASGSRCSAPIKDPNITLFDPQSLYESLDQIEDSKYFLLVGNELEPVQLALEITNKFPNKRVTMVMKEAQLMSRMNSKVSALIEEQLKRRGVTILKKVNWTTFRRSRKQSDGPTYVFKCKDSKDMRVRADQIYWFTNMVPNTEFMRRNFKLFLNNNGFVRVNSKFQLDEYPYIFAGGNCIETEELITSTLNILHARHIVRNLKALALNNRVTSVYKPLVIPEIRLMSLDAHNSYILSFGEIVKEGSKAKKIIESHNKYIIHKLKGKKKRSNLTGIFTKGKLKVAGYKVEFDESLKPNNILIFNGKTSLAQEFAKCLLSQGVFVRFALPIKFNMDDIPRDFPKGIQIVRYSLRKPRTIEKMMTGVSHVFLCTDNGPTHLIDEFPAMIEALGPYKFSIKHILTTCLGSLSASDKNEKGGKMAEWLRKNEKLIHQFGIPHTIVRLAACYQSVWKTWRECLKQNRTILSVKNGTAQKYIDLYDCVDALASIMLNYPEHINQTYQFLNGRPTETLEEVTEELSKTTGEDIMCMKLPVEVATTRWQSIGFSREFSEAVVESFIAISEMAIDADDMEKILGRKPITFSEWIKQNGQALLATMDESFTLEQSMESTETSISEYENEYLLRITIVSQTIDPSDKTMAKLVKRMSVTFSRIMREFEHAGMYDCHTQVDYTTRVFHYVNGKDTNCAVCKIFSWKNLGKETQRQLKKQISSLLEKKLEEDFMLLFEYRNFSDFYAGALTASAMSGRE